MNYVGSNWNHKAILKMLKRREVYILYQNIKKRCFYISLFSEMYINKTLCNGLSIIELQAATGIPNTADLLEELDSENLVEAFVHMAPRKMDLSFNSES